MIQYLDWRWAIFWTWLIHYSSDQVRYEIRQVGQDPDIYTQGETPLGVLKTIAVSTQMTPGVRVLDIGCGRGSALAFWATQYGITPLGIEIVPSLISMNQWLWQHLSVSGTLIQGDFSEVDWPDADIVFIAGTCFSDRLVSLLIQKLKRLSLEVKIAVITLTLPSADFELIAQMPVRFSWGASTLRLYRVAPIAS